MNEEISTASIEELISIMRKVNSPVQKNSIEQKSNSSTE